MSRKHWEHLSGRRRRSKHHFLHVSYLWVFILLVPQAGSYFMSDSKAVLQGCSDHWTLQDHWAMPLLFQMTVCVDVRVMTPGEWTAFSYMSPRPPYYNLALQGDQNALYVWLLGVRHRFPVQLAVGRWYRLCLRRDTLKDSFSLEISGYPDPQQRTVIAQTTPPTGTLVLGCQLQDASPGATLATVELYLFRVWDNVLEHGACEDGSIVGWDSRMWSMTRPQTRVQDDMLQCGMHSHLGHVRVKRNGITVQTSITTSNLLTNGAPFLSTLALITSRVSSPPRQDSTTTSPPVTAEMSTTMSTSNMTKKDNVTSTTATLSTTSTTSSTKNATLNTTTSVPTSKPTSSTTTATTITATHTATTTSATTSSTTTTIPSTATSTPATITTPSSTNNATLNISTSVPTSKPTSPTTTATTITATHTATATSATTSSTTTTTPRNYTSTATTPTTIPTTFASPSTVPFTQITTVNATTTNPTTRATTAAVIPLTTPTSTTTNTSPNTNITSKPPTTAADTTVSSLNASTATKTNSAGAASAITNNVSTTNVVSSSSTAPVTYVNNSTTSMRPNSLYPSISVLAPTTLTVNQTTFLPAATFNALSTAFPDSLMMMQCNLSQFCDNKMLYYWMFVNVTVGNDSKNVQDLHYWFSELFRPECDIQSLMQNPQTTSSTYSDKILYGTSPGTTRTSTLCQNSTVKLQDIILDCEDKDYTHTNCTVLLQLRQSIDTCSLSQLLQKKSNRSTFHVELLGEVARVGRNMCLDEQRFPPRDGFVYCNTSLPLSEACQAKEPVNVTCSYTKDLIPKGLNRSLAQPCDNNTGQYCNCSTFCNDTGGFYGFSLNISSDVVSFDDIKKTITQLECQCNSTKLPSLCKVSSHYQGVHIECHGTDKRIYNCMLVLQLNQTLDLCTISEALLALMQSSTNISFNGTITRIALCGFPSDSAHNLLNSNFTWVSANISANQICALKKIPFACGEGQVHSVLLNESCTAPPLTVGTSPSQTLLVTSSTGPKTSPAISISTHPIGTSFLSVATLSKSVATPIINTVIEPNSTKVMLSSTTFNNTPVGTTVTPYNASSYSVVTPVSSAGKGLNSTILYPTTTVTLPNTVTPSNTSVTHTGSVVTPFNSTANSSGANASNTVVEPITTVMSPSTEVTLPNTSSSLHYPPANITNTSAESTLSQTYTTSNTHYNTTVIHINETVSPSAMHFNTTGLQISTQHNTDLTQANINAGSNETNITATPSTNTVLSENTTNTISSHLYTTVYNTTESNTTLNATDRLANISDPNTTSPAVNITAALVNSINTTLYFTATTYPVHANITTNTTSSPLVSTLSDIQESTTILNVTNQTVYTTVNATGPPFYTNWNNSNSFFSTMHHQNTTASLNTTTTNPHSSPYTTANTTDTFNNATVSGNMTQQNTTSPPPNTTQLNTTTNQLNSPQFNTTGSVLPDTNTTQSTFTTQDVTAYLNTSAVLLNVTSPNTDVIHNTTEGNTTTYTANVTEVSTTLMLLNTTLFNNSAPNVPQNTTQFNYTTPIPYTSINTSFLTTENLNFTTEDQSNQNTSVSIIPNTTLESYTYNLTTTVNTTRLTNEEQSSPEPNMTSITSVSLENLTSSTTGTVYHTTLSPDSTSEYNPTYTILDPATDTNTSTTGQSLAPEETTTTISPTSTTTSSTTSTKPETTTAGSPESGLNNFLNQDTSTLNNSQVQELTKQLENLLSGPNISLESGQLVMSVVNQLLSGSSSAVASSSNRLIKVVETLGLKLIIRDKSESIIVGSLALMVSGIDGSNFRGTSFSVSDADSLQFNSRRRRSVSTTLGSITLPDSLTETLTMEEQQLASRLQFTFYNKSNLFNDKTIVTGQNLTLISHILGMSVANVSIKNLRENVEVTLSNTQPVTGGLTRKCAFWDFDKNEGLGGWNSTGCVVMNTSSENETVCGCNHLTSFAVLLDLSRQGVTDPLQNTILTFITYIGCGISAIFLAVTLLTYIAFEKIRRDIPSKILINLCFALLLLDMVFLLDSWLALYTHAVGLCISTAFFLHYFLLASFTWMGLEALHLYLAIVKVFNNCMSRYILKFMLAGWGIPLLVVIIVIAVDKNNYGLVQYAKYTDGASDDFCWLKNNIAFYVGVVAYFCVIFVFNLIMFVVVMVQLRRIKRQNPHNNQYRSRLHDLKSIAGLTVLLGLTWGFAFFAWGVVSLAFMYLFTILNSLQGFFIFVFHCATKETVRRQWRTYLCCGRLRLAENSDWSRTATQNKTKKTSLTTINSSRSSQIQSTSRSSSLSTNSIAQLHNSSMEDSVSTSVGDTNGDVVLNEINSHITAQN